MCILVHDNVSTRVHAYCKCILSWIPTGNIKHIFNSNLLTFNFTKTHYIEFRTKNYYQVKTKVKYEHKSISNSSETKFLGLIIDETLSWNQHVDYIATKLNSACYTLRNLKHIVPQSILRTIYYAYIRSILSYGIIFWGRSSNVNKLFILQKKMIRIITNNGVRESCREAFKEMEIMTLYSQYFFSLILFTVNNKHLFIANKEIHDYKTRSCANLHLPSVNITKFYKGPLCFGFQSNRLLNRIKVFANVMKCFKLSLKIFLYHHSFYSIDEYYEYNEDKVM